MSLEKLCLKWNDFQENILSGFKDLRNDKEFTDVTMACEDGQRVEAHKVVLTTTSPFFKNLLKSNRHQHPIIYMRSMKSEDLVAIMDFLYSGEANVYQENLDTFLAIAAELQLKGFTGEQELKESDAKDRNEALPQIPPPAWQNSKRPETAFHSESAFHSETAFHSESDGTGTVSLLKTHVGADLDQLDEQIKSMMDLTENFIHCNYPTRKLRRRAHICKVCGKEGKNSDVRRHIEANHISNFSHSCDTCGKTYRSRNGLGQHKSAQPLKH